MMIHLALVWSDYPLGALSSLFVYITAGARARRGYQGLQLIRGLDYSIRPGAAQSTRAM